MASRQSNANGSPRVVLYLRMSTAEQDASIDAQRIELTRLAERKGYTIAGEYLDEAISGDDTERREGFLRMRDDALKGLFDVVLCWDQDRFGRFDLIDGGYYIRPFRLAGVRLETIAQGPVDWEDLTGQLIYSVNQVGKAQFLRDLSRNTCRGMLSSARAGKAGTGGPSPYGYRSKDGEVWIIDEEAEVVRLIFDLYLRPDGSLRGVAGELNRRKITPPRGKVWRDSSVRSILQRRKYTGAFVYGGRNSGKYFAFRNGEIVPRRKSDRTVASEPIVIPNRFEAIVDEETFEKAQAKLAGRRGKTVRKQARQYLLSGLLHCGDCGGSLIGVSRSSGPLYRCCTYHQAGGSACYCNTIPEGPLVDVITRKIMDRYLSEAALDRLRRRIEKRLAERDRPPAKRDLDRLRKQIEALDQKIDQGADRVLDAPAEIVPILIRKLDEHRAERDRLQSDLDALSTRDKRSGKGIDAEVDRAIEALRDLRTALETAKPEDTRELLTRLVSRVELHFDHEPIEGGRSRNTFSHGKIYVRPDAGSGAETDPKSTDMNTIGPYFETPTRHRA